MPKFNPDLHLSDQLMINGKQYDIRKLYADSDKSREHINLRTKTVKKNTRTVVKYSLEERIWQATHSIAEIQTRYNRNELQARSIQWQARGILDRLDIDYKTSK